MKLNVNYKAILALDKLLTTEGIPHELIRILDGWQIFYTPDPIKRPKGDAVQHFGIRKSEEGVMEVWSFGLKEPVRCYSVEETAEYFRKAREEDKQ